MSLSLDRSQWRRVHLGDVVRRSRRQVDPLEQGIQRYVAGGHIDGQSMTITRWGDPSDGQMGSTFRYVFRAGQILFVSARPYLRKCGVVGFEGVVADKTYILDAVPERGLLQDFLPFVLASGPFVAYATREATGSMNPRLLWGPFQRYEFDLPPLEEQQRLADLLWAVEHASGQVSRMHVQISAATDLWLESKLQIGVADRGWRKSPVSELVTDGPTNGKSATANDERRGVPTLSISAIRGGKVLGGDAVKYIDVEPAQVANFTIRPDDFLVVRGNGNKQLTGLGGLADGLLPEGCVYPDLLVRLRFDPQVLLPVFAAAQWNSQPTHSALIQKAKSTNGIWKINGQDLKSHRLVAPPLEDQTRLLGQMETFDSARTSALAEAESLRAMRVALFAEIFGGN